MINSNYSGPRFIRNPCRFSFPPHVQPIQQQIPASTFKIHPEYDNFSHSPFPRPRPLSFLFRTTAMSLDTVLHKIIPVNHLGMLSADSDLVSREYGLGFCSYGKHPGDTCAAGPQTSLEYK